MDTGSMVLEKIESFLLECEESKIVPTAVYMSKVYLNILRKSFPHLLEGPFYKSSKFGDIKVVETEQDYLGAGLVFDEVEVSDNVIKEFNIKTC